MGPAGGSLKIGALSAEFGISPAARFDAGLDTKQNKGAPTVLSVLELK